MTDRAHTVVIGSGFGGSVAAARLAEAGVDVLLLERGPWWDTVPTRSMGIEARTPLPRGRRMLTGFLRTVNSNRAPGGRITLNRRGLVELFFSEGMDAICSSGVGGGSHVYSGVHRRPVREDFWDDVVDGISEASMAPLGEAFLERIGSTTPGPDNRPPNLSADRFHNDPVVEPAVAKAKTRVGMLLPQDPEHPRKVVTEAGVERWEADYRSNDNGFLGSATGAKSTLDICYLAPAIAKGLAVRDLCEVLGIERIASTGRRYAITCRDHRAGRRRVIEAENVIVAAGTMNTLRILLESRDGQGGLAGMPGLGRRFSGNGDMRGFWDLNERDLTDGLPSRGGVMLRDAPEPRLAFGLNSLPNVDGYPLPRRYRERLKRGQVISGMGIDAMDGVISYRGGRLGIDFDPANSPIYGRIYAAMNEISERTGRRIRVARRPSTVHPTGGACLGDFADGGVVGADGQVHDNPGLFVADAAALPAPTGGPPTQTIATWAENVARRFMND